MLIECIPVLVTVLFTLVTRFTVTNDPNPSSIHFIHYYYMIHCIDYNCQSHCPHFHFFHHYSSYLPEVAAGIWEIGLC